MAVKTNPIMKGDQSVNETGSSAPPTPRSFQSALCLSEDDGVEEKREVQEHASNLYPSGLEFFITCIAICLAVFLIALDNNVLATAIPKITDEFHALNDVGWYASSYFLTNCSFLLLLGKLYTFYNIKWIFLISMVIFEIGSLICATASGSTILIVGRAVAGLGSAGIQTGAYVILAHSVPIAKRAAYVGLVGGMWGVAGAAGPLIGGLFSDKVTWRWCFYINVPIGGAAFVAILLSLKLPANSKNLNGLGFTEVLKRLDILGTFTFISAIVCLLLALKWGGTTYKWNEPRIIVLVVFSGLLMVAFCAIQAWLGETATVPSRILKNRTIWGASLFTFCFGGSFWTISYILPIWFQAIQGLSPIPSAIRNLPFIIATQLVTVTSGALITRFGWHTPWAYFCTVFMSIGAGLMMTFQVHTSIKKWFTYQVLFGLGSGAGFQQPIVAVQTVSNFEDMPIVTSLVIFAQQFGGAIWVSAATNVLTTQLLSHLGVGTSLARQIINFGMSNFRTVVPAFMLDSLLLECNKAIVKAFEVALILACVSIVGVVLMENVSVKKPDTSGDVDKMSHA